jgi:hypothetical protein
MCGDWNHRQSKRSQGEISSKLPFIVCAFNIFDTPEVSQFLCINITSADCKFVVSND